MSTIESIKKRGYEIENQLKTEIENISDYIFKNPELGFEEFKSVEFLTKTLKQHGFEIIENYCDLPTGFRAEFSCGEGPSIAFLAEYDALPGYGSDKVPGHACGHNWIAAGTCGAALVLSKLKEDFKGKIIVIGTPAEETIGGKVNMVEADAFDDIDIVLQMHLESNNNLECKTLAIDCIKFQFTGKAAHASSHPEKGVNALDAVQLMFAGINALRQHITPDARIHGIITYGGDAPNTVPDFTEAKFHIRAANRNYLNLLTEKVTNCAKGAALMTGTELHFEKFENSFDNLLNLSSLQNLMRKNLESVGVTKFLEGGKGATGSSDIGNVSQVCPTMYTEMALNIDEICFVHDEAYLKYVNSEEAYDKLHKSVKAMVGTALDISLDSTILKSIKEEFSNLKRK